MEVSAFESFSQIPGFRDRLGERVIVPQPSGALLEYLHFCDGLATAPFFVQALKDRIGRLSTFSGSSYCRVRRVQSITERMGRPALVSAHVGGRRLAEVLDAAARAGLKPTTAGALAVTRQMMASVALLHDFAPDGFHGALGPDRVILAGEGRVVLAEHVLGTVVEQAAAAWSVMRLWDEFRLATLADPGTPQYGRRNDILQVGLVTLAMLLGRPLGPDEFPHELGRLLEQVTETTPDGMHVPVRAGLRTWLERTLSLRGDLSYRTLLEAQKALAQLLQDDGYGASSVAWDAFAKACETAEGGGASAVPLVPVADRIDKVPAPAVGTPSGSSDGAPRPQSDWAAAIREDPFGPWPVAVPSESAATLLETFFAETSPAPPAAPASAPADPSATPGPPGPESWAPAPPAPPPSAQSNSRTLFEADRREPATVVVVPNDAQPRPTVHWDQPPSSASQATSVADWHAANARTDPSYQILYGDDRIDDGAADVDGRGVPSARDPRRWIRLLILGVLTIIATAAAVYSPRAWTLLYEGRRAFGSLTVDSDPAGAIISLDGQVRGHTPAQLTVRAGDHVLEIQSGGSAKSKKIRVSANGKYSERMTFPEAGIRGGLRISTYPTVGRITIDGIPRGPAPVRVTDLAPGAHTLVVDTPLGTQEQDVVVQSGRVSELVVPTAAWVNVTAPYELKVLENGRVLGTVGRASLMVRPGRHYFEFVNQPLGLKLRQYVDAAPGQSVTVPLELPVGMMNLYADQAAEVYVDGQKVGETPLSSLAVPLGMHDVVFRDARYGEVRYTVSVTLAAPVNLNVTFRK